MLIIFFINLRLIVKVSIHCVRVLLVWLLVTAKVWLQQIYRRTTMPNYNFKVAKRLLWAAGDDLNCRRCNLLVTTVFRKSINNPFTPTRYPT